MQIKSARIKSYRSWAVDEAVISEIAKERITKIQSFDKLKSEGCSTKIALEAINVKRATLFLWKKKYKELGDKGLNPKSTRPRKVRSPKWSKEIKCKVYELRKKHPCWGKYKIHKLLAREHNITKISVSTVGRIIKSMIGSGKIMPVSIVTGKNKPKRKRAFKGHAKKWKYGMKAENPGELFQLDHMSVYSNSQCIKHFKGVCPVTKIMVSNAYTRASSRTAKSFLLKLISEVPFEIKSIQVDGGSEFMKDFEHACEELGIELYVLPPRSPKYNGNVERANGTTRDEFYSQYTGVFDLTEIRKALKVYQEMYNIYRPHQALDYLTPFEYTEQKFKIKAA